MFPPALSKAKQVRDKFKHVNCTDNELIKYFKDEPAAQAAMDELHARSWEYKQEFAREMIKQCQQWMRKDKRMMCEDENMPAALTVYEKWYVPYIFNIDSR